MILCGALIIDTQNQHNECYVAPGVGTQNSELSPRIAQHLSG